ncbi:MAG: hypothetical protein JNM89_04340 [Hyphomicrobiaceae bacterium]|nr:hypothetical protein [Hyphomicrobiaceae bacterium]
MPRHIGMPIRLPRHASAAALAMVLGTLGIAEAGAVSLAVQRACMSDYFAHCSKHAPGSPEVRSCMSRVGARLSGRCVNALLAAGEVSKAEVARRSASR